MASATIKASIKTINKHRNNNASFCLRDDVPCGSTLHVGGILWRVAAPNASVLINVMATNSSTVWASAVDPNNKCALFVSSSKLHCGVIVSVGVGVDVRLCTVDFEGCSCVVCINVGAALLFLACQVVVPSANGGGRLRREGFVVQVVAVVRQWEKGCSSRREDSLFSLS